MYWQQKDDTSNTALNWLDMLGSYALGLISGAFAFKIGQVMALWC